MTRPREDRKRGRHRKARSPETLRFERENLPPPCPSWLDSAAYSGLCRLRHRLQLDDPVVRS